MKPNIEPPTAYSSFKSPQRIPKKIGASTFVLLLAALNILIFHYPLLTFSIANLDYSTFNGVLTLLTLFVVVFSVTAVVFFILVMISPYALKAFAAIVVIGNSIAIYFINTYQVILDKSMMSNIFNTRAVESIELVHPKILAYIIIIGVLPAWAILSVRIKKSTPSRIAFHIVLTLISVLLFIYINASSSLWIDKHSKNLGGVILPWSYIVNSIRLQVDNSQTNVEQRLLPAIEFSNDEKTVVVLVIGETARANNFSLYGYDKLTNPLMANTDVIVLNRATSCSTYTTASIHCMLSHNGSKSGSFEPLPSYLQRHGVDVLWRTKNWGEPKIIVQNYVKSSTLKETCTEKHCNYDEVLLSDLVERIQSSQENKVFVVLHTKGSHGPSYSTRYPEAFNKFKPVCKSVELDKCSEEELTNAYNNTILYTDYFLDQTITRLKSLNSIPAMMMYVSDHGESLGEYGLYLHGTPYSIAPDVQKEIPFIIWMSDSFKELKNVKSTMFPYDEYSHSHVFHSIMGAFNARSEVYDRKLDLFNTVVESH